MSSFHKIDDEEIEQSAMKTKLDLITVTGDINLDTLTTISTAQSNKIDFLTVTGNVDLDTISTNVTTNNAKTGITTQQALDIQANNLKTGITNTQTSNINTNNAKVGITTDESNSIASLNTMLQKDGTDTVLKTTGNKIQFYHNDSQLFNSNEIKNLTDNVQISSGVNINTLDTDITGIKNNSLASTLKTAVDANSSKNSYPSADATKVGHITITQPILCTGNELIYNDANFIAGSAPGNELLIQHADLNSGNLHPASCSMRVTSDGDLRLNAPTGRDFEFRINNVKQYDNTELKNLVDNITVSQAVDLDTMESNIATNNAKVGISTTQINAINANSAKVTSNWTINGASEIHRNSNVGIKNSDPNVDLEIGDGTSNPVRIRLNGSNGAAISSEIIFTDNRGGANPDFYNGASIRFNSTDNRLEFLTDDGNDNVSEPAMYIHRSATPYMTTTNILSGDLSVNTCSLKPLSRYCYGRRINSLTDTDNDITLSTTGVDVVYRNILDNGIDYNTSTGVFTVPETALYEVTASAQIDCGPNAESVIQIVLKDAANNNLLKARGHVSKAESNTSTATQLNMIGMIRLVSGTSYNFVVSSKNNGTGVLQNDIATANTLMIKGVVLHNYQTVPSDWGEAA